MDNHLWEHEEIVGAKLIVCVWNACEVGVWGTVVVEQPCLHVCSMFCGLVMDCGVLCSESIFGFVLFMYKLPSESSIYCAFDVFVLSHSNFKPLVCKHRRTHTTVLSTECMRMNPFTHTHHLNVVHLKVVRHPLFQLTLFPLQTTASTLEMSGSLCRCCVASSNICEVLSSSLQLRRAVSQESGLLTPRSTAKTASPSAHPLCPLICINERLY